MIRLCVFLIWNALECFVRALLKRIRTKRKMASWAEHHLDEVAEDFNSDEVSMSNAILTQIALGVLRHVMTSLAPLGVVVSDDWLLQTAGIVVGGAGILWSAARKWKRG